MVTYDQAINKIGGFLATNLTICNYAIFWYIHVFNKGTYSCTSNRYLVDLPPVKSSYYSE
eukprot:SAG11_NODE_1422_length_4951_cov_4.752112_1_plen_60_part_00